MEHKFRRKDDCLCSQNPNTESPRRIALSISVMQSCGTTTIMLQPFTTCFTFLHRKIRFFLNQPLIMDMMSVFYKRKRPNKKFYSSYDLSTSSFLHMELSTQFQQVFKLIDTNGDGKISTTELSEVLSCLGYNKCRAAKEAESMVRVLDFNGDGFVDLDEFMVVMNGMEEREEDKIGSGMEHQDDGYLMDAFLVFDTDKNGLISAKELQRVLLNLGCDDCSLRECKRMIKGVDKNGDGFVDFQEFRSMMQSGLVN
ncbi:putative calcium-binding protein CML25, partial [Mucuna pruriens]